jgi:hypothetical protein
MMIRMRNGRILDFDGLVVHMVLALEVERFRLVAFRYVNHIPTPSPDILNKCCLICDAVESQQTSANHTYVARCCMACQRSVYSVQRLLTLVAMGLLDK